MLHSVAVPGLDFIQLDRGVVMPLASLITVQAAAGFALFDVPSHRLPKAGPVDIELTSPLDGRVYTVRRAADVPEHWQVLDGETGWLASSGSSDVQHWLRANLDIPPDQSLPSLFRELLCFSLSASLAWLLEEPGLRERKLADLVRTDRYPAGLRWVDGVVADARSVAYELECAVRELQGRDALFDAARERFEAARDGAIEASDTLARLQRELEQAGAKQEQLAALRADLDRIQQELDAHRVSRASLEAEFEALNHWLLAHDRARKSIEEHQAEWQHYEEAQAEIGKLATQLTGLDLIVAERQAVKTEVLVLEREQALLQDQLALVQKAESGAADLAQPVQHQQQLEQQIASAHERALRLELAGRGLQAAVGDAKRVEVLLAEVERELSELEQLASDATKVKKLVDELERQRQQLRDANRQVDQLRFLEAAIRAVSGHLDDLRKSSSITERLAVEVGGNSVAKAEDRGVAAHLRQAVDHQLRAVERQLNDWRVETRALADAPQRVDQLRSTMHQLQQEIDAARQVQIKLGAIPALKQQRKQLREHFDQLKKTVDSYAKEQRESADAATLGAQLRQELGALDDPRSERQALLRQAAPKKELESAARETAKSLDERRKRQAKVEEQKAALDQLQQVRNAQEDRRDQAAAGHREYLVQQAIAQLTAPVQQDLERVTVQLTSLREAIAQAEAQHSALSTSVAELQDVPLLFAALQARLAESETRASEWQARKQSAEDDLAAAQGNRETLRQRQNEMATHRRAEQLLLGARETVARAEVVLGTQIRQDLAAKATSYLQCLLDDAQAAVAWPWAEPPAVITAGGTRGLVELDPNAQACCLLALRLSLAAQATRFGTVFVSDLGASLQSTDMIARVQRLAGLDQLLAMPA